MAVKQAPPDEGDGQARLHFSYVPTPAKAPWLAYVAGPCMWYKCHEKGKTKPCLELVTDGALSCPRCHEITPPETTGYMPLYRVSDWKPVVVIVHKHLRELVDKLKLHAKVHVKREHGIGEGVQLIYAVDQLPKFVSSDKAKTYPQQPIGSLLRMWGYPELIEWHNETSGDNVPMCITHPVRKIRQPLAPKETPSASPGTYSMGETAMEAIEALRQRNEAFAREIREKKKPD